tara:strand:- start:356 stop:517 length:162 start_codon:yes stop_codon:yes gene_type:complete
MKTKKCEWCNEKANRTVYGEHLCERHYQIIYEYPEGHKVDYTPKEILNKSKPF